MSHRLVNEAFGAGAAECDFCWRNLQPGFGMLGFLWDVLGLAEGDVFMFCLTRPFADVKKLNKRYQIFVCVSLGFSSDF